MNYILEADKNEIKSLEEVIQHYNHKVMNLYTIQNNLLEIIHPLSEKMESNVDLVTKQQIKNKFNKI